jgi:H(+)-translocating pyrophosphatase
MVLPSLNCTLASGGGCETSGTDMSASVVVIGSAIIGILFGIFQYMQVSSIQLRLTPEAISMANDELKQGKNDETSQPLQNSGDDFVTLEQFKQLDVIWGSVKEGASAFLKSQYSLCVIFTAVFSLVIFVLCSSTTKAGCEEAYCPKGDKSTEHAWEWAVGGLTACSFAVGALTSILAGYIGMYVAVEANAKVTTQAACYSGAQGWRNSFNAAFIAGSVMGFALCGLALIVLYILINIFTNLGDDYSMDKQAGAKKLFECIAGYGLGGSSMALFGRVGGGIFTKAADVGADLSGKVAGVRHPCGAMVLLDEDSPMNPATIADNVGDNVGDVAGMGSDLFGSFAEATCAALVISASSAEIASVGFSAYMYPLLISGAGIICCLLTSFIATHVQSVAAHKDVELVLKVQLAVSALLMTLATLPLSLMFLPNTFSFEGFNKIEPSHAQLTADGHLLSPVPVKETCEALHAWICVIGGLWGGCIIGFVTEYYTSHSYEPVKELAQSCTSGAATNIIYGLALGYQSCIIPILILAGNVFISFYLCGMYGVSLAALGMLGTLATCLSIDVYGPIADNAGGLAEMAEFDGFVRMKTDALDAAGNTTAAIGKGFAIGSAALVSLALFGGFIARLAAHSPAGNPVIIDVLQPITFAFLFLGAMLPYWFTAFCMKSVGQAASAMVQNVADQFNAPASDGSGEKQGLHILERGLPFEVFNEKKELVDYYSTKFNCSDAESAFKAMRKSADEKMQSAGANNGKEWGKPDYQACIAISTNASLKEMVPPAMLVMLAPLLTGALFGVEAVSGLLVGSLISAVQLAISQSNSGGAWDNAKKYTEGGNVAQPLELWNGSDTLEEAIKRFNDTITWKFGEDHEAHKLELLNHLEQNINAGGEPTPYTANGGVIHGKKSEVHQAAVVGDTVGDPLKDTSGPALNIVMKLMAILSLVFSDFFVSINEGRGLFSVPTSLDLSCTNEGFGCNQAV